MSATGPAPPPPRPPSGPADPRAGRAAPNSAAAGAPSAGLGGRRRPLRRWRERLARLWAAADRTTRWIVIAGAAISGAFVVLAAFASLIAPYGQAEFDGLPQLAEPSLDHLFGTTNLKYDVLSRVLFGSRLALSVVLISTTFALVIGVPLGLAAGYAGGRLDRILVVVMDALYAFPALLLAIVAAFALRDFVGQGVPAAALSISVIYVPQYFRVVRNHTLAVREEPYVDAARAMGARPRTVVTRYVAANVLQSVPVIFTVNAADAVLTLAGLGFLGYGVPPRTAEWGYDIAKAISDVGTGSWWTSLFPGLAILTLVTGLSLLGEGVNDLFNPRLRQAGLRLDPEDKGTGALPDTPVAAPTPPAPDPRSSPHPDTGSAERRSHSELLRSNWRSPHPDSGTEERQFGKTARPGRNWRSSHANRGAEERQLGGTGLQVAGVSVTYPTSRGPVRAVDGVSLTVAPGESLGLVGESGCGKSSLGRAVLGLLPAGARLAGTVAVDGEDLTADPDAWRAARGERIAMVFQDPATRLDPLQRIEHHFVETIRAHRPDVSRATARRMTTDALTSVGVPPGRARQYPHEFSGGMRQRIMIALATVLHPRVLVADEPTTSLDVLVEAQVLRLLDQLRRDQSIGVILITHNLAIVAETCDRVAVMYAGRIVEEGPVEMVFARAPQVGAGGAGPAHPYTQALLASVISLDTNPSVGALAAIPSAPPDLAAGADGLPPGCRFAPRCPHVMPVCTEVAPTLAPPRTTPTHLAACHLYPAAGAGPAPPATGDNPSGEW